MEPLCTVVIPTFDRPASLARAVASALAQTLTPLEVVVVDDGSAPAAAVPDDPRVQLVRLAGNQGGAVARNAGIAAARGKYITFLDDDDVLLPGAAQVGFATVAATLLPPPVGALSGIEVVDAAGNVVGRRIPPTTLRGTPYGLTAAPAGTSYLCKQTLFIATEVLRDIGGFDEAFRSRVHTELFLRLSQVASLAGAAEVTYRLTRGDHARVSTDPVLRNASFEQLVARHRDSLRAHPHGHARMLIEHARTQALQGETAASARSLARALMVAPRPALHATAQEAAKRLRAIVGLR